MPHYSEERKSAVLKKLLPPNNRSVPDVAREEGISEQTLYNWRKTLRDKGLPVPGNEQKSEQWPAESKFAVVVETAVLSEAELSEYCRKNGLYPQQVKEWKQACISGADQAVQRKDQENKQSKQERKLIQSLEKELRRKDKALAEAAALLVLSKKLDAFYGIDNEVS
jgi:transposase